jgi:hypothetical protein
LRQFPELELAEETESALLGGTAHTVFTRLSMQGGNER